MSKHLRYRSIKHITVLIVSIFLVTLSTLARGQAMSNGADNFYTSDKVTIQKVSFKNQYNMTVVGNLFIPKEIDKTIQHPAIIVGHPMGAVKEQSANLYATKMAEQGFVTLSFDLSFWGESEGHLAMRFYPIFMQKISVLLLIF